MKETNTEAKRHSYLHFKTIFVNSKSLHLAKELRIKADKQYPFLEPF